MDVRLRLYSLWLRQIRATHKGKRVDDSTPREGRNKVRDPSRQENSRSAIHFIVTVPQTDTGRWGENPQALVRTLVQELGKMYP
jgi:hypothetical protein